MMRTWVALWDRWEHPCSLGILRIVLALVFGVDLLEVGHHGLVIPLMAEASYGGWGDASSLSSLLGGDMHAAYGLYTVRWLAVVGLLLGFGTRACAVVLALTSAQVALGVPYADRGIDTLLRNVLWIMVFARCDAWLSVAAWRRTGSVWGDGEPVPAWPRHVLVLQLVVVYFTAGVQKFGFLWTPMGSYSALYMLLQDVAIARADWSWMANTPWVQCTQVATFVTVVWEWSAPLVLWVYWGRLAPQEGSALRRWAVRHQMHLVWLSVGVVFHVGIALTLQLGIFPWAMLALYVVFVHPKQWHHLWRVSRRRGALSQLG